MGKEQTFHQRMANRYMKRCSTSQHLGKCKLIPGRDTTTYVLEQLAVKTMTMPKADEEKPNLSYIVGDDVKQCRHSEKQFGTFLKAKFINIIQSSNHPPKHLPRKMKAYIHRKICTQIFTAALFGKTKIWKQPKCSITC